MIRRGEHPGSDTRASSVQIGFILNTGIMTISVALLLVVLSGGFTDDSIAEKELEIVADEIQANIIEADSLAVGQGEFRAFFEPPDSGVDYVARIEKNGLKTNLTVADNNGNVVRRRLNETTETPCCNLFGSSEVEFTERDRNIVINYSDSNPDLYITVQEGFSRSGNVSGS